MQEPTHWKQTLFHLHEPIAVATGSKHILAYQASFIVAGYLIQI